VPTAVIYVPMAFAYAGVATMLACGGLIAIRPRRRDDGEHEEPQS
jgi:hypothetical protein